MSVPAFRVFFSAIALSAALLPNAASAAVFAQVIDKTVNINVYQVCETDGTGCASKGPATNNYFAAETNKIWAQAGISVNFEFVLSINDSNYLNLYDVAVPGENKFTFGNLHALYGTMGPSDTGVDLFLVNDHARAYGVGWYGQGGLVMSMQSIMDFNCGGAIGCIGRIDTLAHELGHDFGMVSKDGAFAMPGDTSHSTEDKQLMAPGSSRTVPTTMMDINPSGHKWSSLTWPSGL